jgi:hypothetical protein
VDVGFVGSGTFCTPGLHILMSSLIRRIPMEILEDSIAWKFSYGGRLICVIKLIGLFS